MTVPFRSLLAAQPFVSSSCGVTEVLGARGRSNNNNMRPPLEFQEGGGAGPVSKMLCNRVGLTITGNV